MRKISKARGLNAAVMGLLGAAALNGCVVAGGGGGGGDYYPPESNYEPYISDLYVDCGWDTYYQTYAWDFVAYVDDADGFDDVRQVSVDVIDMVYTPNEVAESWDLAYDGSGQWSQTIYEDTGVGNPYDYTQILQCEYIYDFEFDFYAIDSYGGVDSVTYVP